MAAKLLQFHFCHVYVMNIFLAWIRVLSFTAVPSVIVLRTTRATMDLEGGGRLSHTKLPNYDGQIL